MIDHVILTISDFKRSVAFYAKVLNRDVWWATTAPNTASTIACVCSLRSNKPTSTTLRAMAPSIAQSPWFTRLLLPVIAAVLIDGLSEALKTFGTFIDSTVSLGALLQRMDWEGAFIAIMGIAVLAVALYFALRSFAKYESENLAIRTAVLVLALILVGASHMWPVIFDRSLMHHMYGEINPGKTTLHDIDTRFLADWNKSISFHSDDPTDRCTNACSFAFVYSVPKLFREGDMTLKFGADKTILQKCWSYDCDPK